jgi:large subunit ribosomal protein L35
MPKMKTHSGAKKRFRKLKNKIKFSHASKRHLLSKKTSKRKRNMRRTGIISAADEGRVSRLLPNS